MTDHRTDPNAESIGGPTMNKPPARPVLTLARPPAKPVLPAAKPAPTRPVLTLAKKPQATAPTAAKPAAAPPPAPVKPQLTSEQKAARDAEEQRIAARARAKAVKVLRADLQATYPLAFPSPPAAPAPLAIGIHKAIWNAGDRRHSMKTVAVFMRRWVGATPYLQAVAAGEMRRNLDGTPAGEPTDHERRVAAEFLEARRQRDAERVALVTGAASE